MLWALLGTRVASPRELPLVLLVSLGLRAVVARAGRGALAPVGARGRPLLARADARPRRSFERTHLTLARKNLGDLAPPRLVYLLLFTHPTPPERLALGRAWAAAG